MATGSTMSLNGRIEKTDIPTLLRSVEKEKNSGELSFTKSSERIELYFLFGQLYHAKWGSVEGVEAVSELLNWKNGNYSFTEGIIPAQATINEDLEKILNDRNGNGAVEPIQVPPRYNNSLPPTPPAPAVGSWSTATPPAAPPAPMPAPPPGAPADLMSDLIPFDLASLDSMSAVFPVEPGFESAPAPSAPATTMPGALATYGASPAVPGPPRLAGDEQSANKVAPAPPAGGLYRTRLFCLPTGEQMATSLVATGPQLEEELLHLSEVKFTGYVLGGPEINGFPSVGVCLLRGRFIHAFFHQAAPNGMSLLEGERAYRTALDQTGVNSQRFYWFYELTHEAMRAAISLLTPPTRYAHLEVRILRFKELLRLLNEESFTGTLRITIPGGAIGPDRQVSPMAGERAYIPCFHGQILGLWSENAPRLTNDGQLLQRFLNEPQAYLDLHSTAPVADPGLPLESLISLSTTLPAVSQSADFGEPSTGGFGRQGTAPLPGTAVSTRFAIPPQAAAPEPAIPALALVPETTETSIDDDERQLLLITSISRMESTWTQMQKKGRMENQTLLMALNGFANEVLSLLENVAGQRGVQEMIQRSMKNELALYRSIFQLLDIGNGRLNVVKLLKEYEAFSRQGNDAADDFGREAGKGLRTLLRSAFQYYVSLIRSETTRFESHDMYEVFLQEVVKKM